MSRDLDSALKATVLLAKGTLELDNRITLFNEFSLYELEKEFWKKANQVIKDREICIDCLIAYRGGLQKIEFEMMKSNLKQIEQNWQREIDMEYISSEREKVHKDLWKRCNSAMYKAFDTAYFNVPEEMRQRAKNKALDKKPFEDYLTTACNNFIKRSVEEKDREMQRIKTLDKKLVSEIISCQKFLCGDSLKFCISQKFKEKETLMNEVLSNFVFLNNRMKLWMEGIDFHAVGTQGLSLDIYLFI